jgi:putative colanic acid biosynthesis acetyltransferase WcaF
MTKVDLSKYQNNSYVPGSKLKVICWYIVNRVIYESFIPYPLKLKVYFLKLFGARIGEGFVIKPKVSIKYPWLLDIGNHVWIGEKVWIDNLAKIKIENNVCISQGAMLLCGNHNYKKATFDLIVGEIVLEEGAWVGAKSVVCPGVTLKSHAILAAGSIATQDLEPYSIYQGNPAIKIRERKIES